MAMRKVAFKVATFAIFTDASSLHAFFMTCGLVDSWTNNSKEWGRNSKGRSQKREKEKGKEGKKKEKRRKGREKGRKRRGKGKKSGCGTLTTVY